jgi:hypothetical protein
MTKRKQRAGGLGALGQGELDLAAADYQCPGWSDLPCGGWRILRRDRIAAFLTWRFDVIKGAGR